MPVVRYSVRAHSSHMHMCNMCMCMNMCMHMCNMCMCMHMSVMLCAVFWCLVMCIVGAWFLCGFCICFGVFDGEFYFR